MGAHSVVQAEAPAGAGQAEAPRERTVGEALYQQPAAGLATTLRPQQSRNVVWRWHMRRRQRAG
jgi:hypothetical protein